ncbi:MAG: hypothetical protein PHW04_09535 [Candidatus Wallbacteria bacterium]|nr:hypothetical protein [Candidatus Wallbacteria bacterium]
MKLREITILFAVFTLSYYWQIFAPFYQYHSSLQAKNQEKKTSEEQWADYNKDLGTLEARLTGLSAKFLSAENFIDFGFRFNGLCEKSRLVASEITYQEAREGSRIRTRRFLITASGDYEKVRNIVRKAEEEFPFMIIDTIDQLGDSGEGNVNLKFGGVLILKK